MVGFDSLFDKLERVADDNKNSYPPHNLIKLSDEDFEIQLAVAGYDTEDIDVSFEDTSLTITGDKRTDLIPEDQILHKGIGTRKFTKQFNLAEHVSVEKVFLQNGILTISLKKEIPEKLKTKTFKIETSV